MNLSNSKYYNSLPPAIRESICRSGMTFENDEEISMYARNAENLSASSSFQGYPYALGFSPFWPLQMF